MSGFGLADVPNRRAGGSCQRPLQGGCQRFSGRLAEPVGRGAGCAQQIGDAAKDAGDVHPSGTWAVKGVRGEDERLGHGHLRDRVVARCVQFAELPAELEALHSGEEPRRSRVLVAGEQTVGGWVR